MPTPARSCAFKQEFRSLSDISHPNLVNLYELFAVDDRWFFTMELVEGTDFVVLCGRRPIWRSRARRRPAAGTQRAQNRLLGCSTRPGCAVALLQLAEGMDALHQANKLHRDIKPPNVLVSHEGRVVLLDFGLTADLERSGRFQPSDRQVVGTVGHMSPEQAAGRGVTAASDWYSVGVILFEALTGRLPFLGAPTRS